MGRGEEILNQVDGYSLKLEGILKCQLIYEIYQFQFLFSFSDFNVQGIRVGEYGIDSSFFFNISVMRTILLFLLFATLSS